MVIHWKDNESLKFLVADIVWSIVLPAISVDRTLYIPLAALVTVPAATADSSNWFLNSTVAMLASSIDFQSTSLT